MDPKACLGDPGSGAMRLVPAAACDRTGEATASFCDMDVNELVTALPSVSAPVRRTTERIAAVRAYSIAVAPESHFPARVQSTFIMEVPSNSVHASDHSSTGSGQSLTRRAKVARIILQNR